jgi:hypothetical protein
MRLIYAFLAMRMIRLARFDVARSELLYADAEAAFARAKGRARLADELALRSGCQPFSFRSWTK